jgi:hypothetical protein
MTEVECQCVRKLGGIGWPFRKSIDEETIIDHGKLGGRNLGGMHTDFGHLREIINLSQEFRAI